jgi:AraC-like DNA-binding protein
MFLKKYSSLLLRERWKMLRHLIIWTIYVFIHFPITYQVTDVKTEVAYDAIRMLLNMAFIYANLLFLVPRYLQKGKYMYYVAFSFLLINTHFVLDAINYLYFPKVDPWIKARKSPLLPWEMLILIGVYNFFYLLGLLAYLFLHYIRLAITGEKNIPLFAARQDQQTDRNTDTIRLPKYVHSTLSPQQAEVYYRRVLQALETEKVYQNPNLTIGELAEQLGIPLVHLSQVVNDKFGKNFNDLLNSYRVESFKEKLLEPDNHKYTIVALAFESGFNSKSAFNAIFKKYTGTTPSQFKASLELK